MELNWYALQVRPRCESSCEALLTSKGYEVFFPRFATQALTQSKRAARPPLFPGYLFCRLTHNSVGKMVMTPGAVRLLGIGNRPEPVADHEMESLRRIDESGIARQPWRYLPGGSMVAIESGPLNGVQGVLLTDGSARRLVVSVTLLHRSVSVELAENTQLKALGSWRGREWKADTPNPPHELISTSREFVQTCAVSQQGEEDLRRMGMLSNAS